MNGRDMWRSASAALLVVAAGGCPADPPAPPMDAPPRSSAASTSELPLAEVAHGTAASAALTSAPKLAPAVLPPLDPQRRAKAQAVLGEARPGLSPWEYRALVGKALGDLERGRLPAGVLSGLALQGVAPGEEAARLARSIDDTDFVLAWRRACRGGDAVARRLAAVPQDQHGRLLWQSCGFWEAGLIREGQLAEADPWALIHAHAVHAYLADRGGVDPFERDLLRRFALGHR